ncbi:MAG TPA: hypothetical protein VF442_05555, partial [Sphingobium sp.]
MHQATFHDEHGTGWRFDRHELVPIFLKLILSPAFPVIAAGEEAGRAVLGGEIVDAPADIDPLRTGPGTRHISLIGVEDH